MDIQHSILLKFINYKSSIIPVLHVLICQPEFLRRSVLCYSFLQFSSYDHFRHSVTFVLLTPCTSLVSFFQSRAQQFFLTCIILRILVFVTLSRLVCPLLFVRNSSPNCRQFCFFCFHNFDLHVFCSPLQLTAVYFLRQIRTSVVSLCQPYY